MKVQFEENEKLKDNIVIIQAKQKTEEIDLAIKNIENSKGFIQCSRQKKSFLIPCNDFFKFFSSNKKIYGLTHNHEYMLNHRLYELEVFLQSNFIRISNTEIINTIYVKYLELTKSGNILIFFNNGEQTSSSRRYLNILKESLL